MYQQVFIIQHMHKVFHVKQVQKPFTSVSEITTMLNVTIQKIK